jgi:dTDP-4-dehydrorhamnose 3,5-epimerase
MHFKETKLKGAYIIEIEKLEDERGFFGRSFCVREFEKHGLNPRVVQCNISYNRLKGTLRGMHYQAAPHAEAKLVRCIRGAIYDVIVDLRPDSSTYKIWFGVELSAPRSPLTAHYSGLPANGSPLTAQYNLLYIPENFAHGFITLEDHTEVSYQMSEFYDPGSAKGFRWDDPTFKIHLPIKVTVISNRDASYPRFSP